LPTQVNDRVFNLEGRVEFGGELRCVQVDEDGIRTVEIQNEVYKTPDIKAEETVTSSSIADTIIALRANKYIQEKKYGNISSFNFTKQAFYDKVWDEQTVKARGLYLDTMKGKVAARAYEKFFNVNERPETKFDMLQYKLQFPVTAYVKENGFLGIVSYDEYNDDLLIASKSTMDSEFAQWLKEMLYAKVSADNIEKMKQFIKEKDVSFVFECVDMKNDPHIIEYPESKLFLLDIVHNDMTFAKYEYDEMVNVANQFGLTPKEKAFEIATWQEFFDWYYDVLEADYEYNGRQIEGFVIEDSAGYMTKLKLTYYNFWKFMRGVSHEAIRSGYIKKTSALTTPLANEYYAWVRKFHDSEDRDNIPRDICTLRNWFYKDRAGK
jgi:tRNA splicing ligase